MLSYSQQKSYTSSVQELIFYLCLLTTCYHYSQPFLILLCNIFIAMDQLKSLHTAQKIPNIFSVQELVPYFLLSIFPYNQLSLFLTLELDSCK